MTPELMSIEPLNSSVSASTVGAVAHKIFEKQFSKFVKWEPEVLTDLAPEPLHQMRVTSRKLRTALQLFKPFILVKPSLYQDFSKVAKCLGTVRDLDVLKLRLQEFQIQPRVSLEEQAQLYRLIDVMDRIRQKRFKRLTKTLTGSTYKGLLHRCQDWFDAPQFNLEAQWQTTLALPDLLMPFVHAWLNHPGWLAEETVFHESPNNGEPSNNGEPMVDSDKVFHDLRKLTKQVRYQTEFFTAFYGPELSVFIAELKTIQERLGEQQDNVVFAAFLEKRLGTQWQTKVPSLAETLQQAQSQFHHQWQGFRDLYLNAEVRGERRSLFLSLNT
jgi:CHAD domain-containing protein